MAFGKASERLGVAVRVEAIHRVVDEDVATAVKRALNLVKQKQLPMTTILLIMQRCCKKKQKNVTSSPKKFPDQTDQRRATEAGPNPPTAASDATVVIKAKGTALEAEIAQSEVVIGDEAVLEATTIRNRHEKKAVRRNLLEETAEVGHKRKKVEDDIPRIIAENGLK